MAIDPAQERQRLMEVYSHKTDGELQDLAENTASLTSLANQVLNDEMARRELSPLQPDPDGSQDETALRSMVTIRSFPDVMQAWLAKSSLESAGIECYLVDDNMVRLDWGISIVLGGVKLRVTSEDAETALVILDQPVPEELGDDDPE
jgi:Putative prokaryotic signal transducing protein